MSSEQRDRYITPIDNSACRSEIRPPLSLTGRRRAATAVSEPCMRPSVPTGRRTNATSSRAWVDYSPRCV